jgi:hypothetical protein
MSAPPVYIFIHSLARVENDFVLCGFLSAAGALRRLSPFFACSILYMRCAEVRRESALVGPHARPLQHTRGREPRHDAADSAFRVSIFAYFAREGGGGGIYIGRSVYKKTAERRVGMGCARIYIYIILSICDIILFAAPHSTERRCIKSRDKDSKLLFIFIRAQVYIIKLSGLSVLSRFISQH